MTDQPRFNGLQQVAYNEIINKKNCFITGPGGTGKSYLIKQIKIDLESKYQRRCDITSTTGISANIINGTTIHSHFGLGLGRSSYDVLYKSILFNKRILNRWTSANVLVIDEVSMLSISLFEKIEKLARSLRKCDQPFGGIQIILVADFLQLPPVECGDFIFESPIWDTVIQKTIYLKQIMRQDDPVFQQVLNKVRLGLVDDEVEQILQSRAIRYKSVNGMQPMMMYSTNAQVDKANKKYYNRLNGDEFTYKMKFKWFQNIIYKEKYTKNLRFQDEVSLKKGAQVMYLTNMQEGLFNGSIGVIKEIGEDGAIVIFSTGVSVLITPETLDIEENDKIIVSYTQIPLKLAYAASIHKLQGSTISLARIDIKNIFECGQFYVAISRVRDLNGLYLRNLNLNLIKSNPKAVEFYKKIEETNEFA